MMATQLAQLLAGNPPGVGEALDLVADFDHVLLEGFARLNEPQRAALMALSDVLAPTPLGQTAAEAVEKIMAGSVTAERLTVLAGARAALFGAVHDALLDVADTALGRTRTSWQQSPSGSAPVANPLAGCRSWLTELALTGWRGIDHDVVAAFDQPLRALLADPVLRRAAVLLDGFAAELRASCPGATMERVPVRRWADLWARALLLTQAGPDDCATGTTVSGRLLILGVEVHEHGTAVQVQAHGVLEPADGATPRLVRTSISATKVDTISGPALWHLLQEYPVLLGALAGHHSLEVNGLVLLDSGDLVWADDRACPGEPVDPFAVARVQLGNAVAPAVPPLDRHPVRIAEPVLIEGYAVSDEPPLAFEVGGHRIPVATDRLPTCGPIRPELVAASSACIGLLRWDGGRWMLQPLAVQAKVGRRTVTAHNGDWALGPTDTRVAKALAKAGDPVAVLRERAGRLLRK